MNIAELVTSPVSEAISLAIGALLSFFITRWALGKSEETQLLTAAEGIRGAADRLVEIDHNAREILDRLEQDVSMSVTSSPVVGTGEFAGLLSTNKQLSARLQQGSEAKMATGKYIQRLVSPGASFAVDCGTSTAWAWFEMIRHGNMDYRLITNNIFVASSMAAEFHYSDEADIWCVDEIASECFLAEGYYFPSYGGILDTREDSEERYLAKLQGVHKPGIVMLGCTSFRAAAGPSARSGANRRFKRSLLTYTAQREHVKLFLLLSIGKIGRQIGEPCDEEIWHTLLQRSNVHVLCGVSKLPDDLSMMTDNETAYLREELRTLDSLDAKLNFVAIDVFGASIDLRAHWES